MMVIKLNILNERALKVIRYLEEVKDIEVVEMSSGPENEAPIKWGGMINNPSAELLAYADEVRNEWEEKMLTSPKYNPSLREKMNFIGALAKNPEERTEMEKYFDDLRG